MSNDKLVALFHALTYYVADLDEEHEDMVPICIILADVERKMVTSGLLHIEQTFEDSLNRVRKTNA